MASSTSDVYVWTWLPGATEPVVAGRLVARGNLLWFGYAASYRANPSAVSLYGPELPLTEGLMEPGPGLDLAGTLRDGAPDAWGRRVIESRLGVEEGSIGETRYMLESGTNRFGANDFQSSPERYEHRLDHASLEELQRAAELLQEGEPLSPSLSEALVHGTTIGGARPKVLVSEPDGTEWIAKLSASSDRLFSVPNAEGASLELARRCGLDVVEARVATSLGREVLLVKRFDRETDGRRHHVVSALTMSGEHENAARYVTYPAVLEVLRRHGAADAGPGRDLFARIAFNIAISNSDDHARNHAAFWDGSHLRLTPAYDLAPGPRSGQTATQAMAYGPGGEKGSNFAALLDVCHVYDLDRHQARDVIDRIIDTVESDFHDAADMNRMTKADRARMKGRQFLNPGALHGWKG